MTKYWKSSMLTQLGKGPMPKPEIRSVAVSGMVITFQPSSGLNSFSIRLISVVFPAAGPPVSTILVMLFPKTFTLYPFFCHRMLVF